MGKFDNYKNNVKTLILILTMCLINLKTFAQTNIPDIQEYSDEADRELLRDAQRLPRQSSNNSVIDVTRNPHPNPNAKPIKVVKPESPNSWKNRFFFSLGIGFTGDGLAEAIVVGLLTDNEDETEYEKSKDNEFQISLKLSIGYIYKFTKYFGLKMDISYRLLNTTSFYSEDYNDYFHYIDFGLAAYLSLPRVGLWFGMIAGINISARSYPDDRDRFGEIIFDDENKIIFGFVSGFHVFLTKGFSVGLELIFHITNYRKNIDRKFAALQITASFYF